jgi:hypothetical protein
MYSIVLHTVSQYAIWGQLDRLQGPAMKSSESPTPEEMLHDIKTRPTVPLWPHAGWACGLSRGGTYEAARLGRIATLELGRKKPALTAPLRKQLGIEA